MDHWTYHSTDVEVPDTPPPLLNEDSLVGEVRRARAKQAETARVSEREQTHAVGSPAETDVPLPFATPPGAALTF